MLEQAAPPNTRAFVPPISELLRGFFSFCLFCFCFGFLVCLFGVFLWFSFWFFFFFFHLTLLACQLGMSQKGCPVRPYCDIFTIVVHLRFVYFGIKIQMARTISIIKEQSENAMKPNKSGKVMETISNI